MTEEHRPLPPPPNEEFAPPAGDFEPRKPGRPPRQRHGEHFDIVSIFLFLLTMSLSIALQTALRWRMTEKRALQAEAEKAQAELAFLKAPDQSSFPV